MEIDDAGRETIDHWTLQNARARNHADGGLDHLEKVVDLIPLMRNHMVIGSNRLRNLYGFDQCTVAQLRTD